MGKYYAVKKGLETGIFYDWSEVEPLVKGYPGAQFKSFTSKKDARKYLGLDDEENLNIDAKPKKVIAPKKCAIAYTDGSFNPDTNKAGYGAIVTIGDGTVEEMYGSVDSLGSRQITGETTAAMLAVTLAVIKGMKRIEIRYDYGGVEKWATGAWSSAAECSVEYCAFMKKMSKLIDITFEKVDAHTGVEGNEYADALAKKGCGVT